jgi:lambda repressor-like predicted transcriptional regulator
MSTGSSVNVKLRGNLKATPQLREFFSYLKYYPQYDPKKGGETRKKYYNGWHVEGEKADSKGIFDFTDLGKHFGISDEQAHRLIRMFPKGFAEEDKTRKTEPKFVQEYRQSVCHKTILKAYADPLRYGQTHIVGVDKSGAQIEEPFITGQGLKVDKVGEELYYMFKQDPATLTIEQFRQAREADLWKDSRGLIKFSALSGIRIVMGYAGFNLAEGTPLNQEWSTKGIKEKGQKKGDYLTEPEIVKIIHGFEEIDTLVLFRMGMEGGGRFSATSMVTADDFHWDTFSISMRETKTDDNPERVFTNESLAFFQMYMRDYQIKGRLFERSPSYKNNYALFEQSIKKAGFNADIWWYRRLPDSKGQFEENGKIYRVDERSHIVYAKTAFRSKGQTLHKWVPVEEGKDVGTHTSMKHTFVSIASQHGFSLGDCSQQTGTDIKTLTEFYHGTQLAAMQRLVRGEIKQEPWNKWIPRYLEPEYQKAYAKLKTFPNPSAGGKLATTLGALEVAA